MKWWEGIEQKKKGQQLVVALRFALFNIMTGVFVERALTAAIPDRQKLSPPLTARGKGYAF